jgi:two-component system chemotaxis sensor kinase CheA
VEQLSRVTQDLQMSVLSTRMQPIKKVFDKIPRQVRELKTQLKKEVNVIIEGEMTEVDKSLVEDLADPMVHMIRNAMDHGIETPDIRMAAGKHPEGTLVVRAFYEGNNVVIQVQDDGAGIDPVKIRQVAVKKGVVTDIAANAMSDAEAVRLIMAPGFSTAEKVTDVSGRGVGMDVVNTKIGNLQGSVDITSELGVGTCFSIYMPLTLAIVNALIVGAREEGFAIPIGDISEVIKFKRTEIHHVNDQDVIELRGESLPLFYLAKLTKHGYVRAYNEGVSAKQLEEARKIAPRQDLTLDDLEKVVALSH